MNIKTNILKRVYDYSNKDYTEIIRSTAAISQVLSTSAYVGSIATNNEIPKKQKGFLILQELFEGGIALSISLLLSKKLKSIGAALYEQKFICPNFFKQLPYKNSPADNIIFLSKIEEETFLNNLSASGCFAGTVVATCIVSPIMKNIFSSLLMKLKNKIEQKQAPKIEAERLLPSRKKSVSMDDYVKKINSPTGMPFIT